MYGAYIYDTAEILLRTDGRKDGRTDEQGDSRSRMQCSMCSVAVCTVLIFSVDFVHCVQCARCNIMRCSVWSARTVIAGKKNCALCNVQYTVKCTYEMRSVQLCRFQCKVCVG